jgi:hypothetical protein
MLDGIGYMSFRNSLFCLVAENTMETKKKKRRLLLFILTFIFLELKELDNFHFGWFLTLYV